ncbi:MAG: hypothetical protein FLDDKLPJ_02067 [Phycisphaerae bacterium]|nr:hypothetical protein [Phycisphaerae bacterium]
MNGKRMLFIAAAPVLAALCLMAIPASAQRAKEMPPDDPQQVRQVVDLISQGQLNLPAAIELAEKHVKGTAYNASADIETHPAAAPGKPGNRPDASSGPSPSSQDEGSPSAQRKLIYTVRCFAENRMLDVRVDGMAKKVLDIKEQTDQEQPDKPKLDSKGSRIQP